MFSRSLCSASPVTALGIMSWTKGPCRAFLPFPAVAVKVAGRGSSRWKQRRAGRHLVVAVAAAAAMQGGSDRNQRCTMEMEMDGGLGWVTPILTYVCPAGALAHSLTHSLTHLLPGLLIFLA
ncbi:hypothetical protein DL95DRAFT_2247 [Leptodontidium sp. 2 PMI_412]|nr:hypothetical protein DL95DRAFT_2247 [Leptodontidium sp. 2 PMI_412]